MHNSYFWPLTNVLPRSQNHVQCPMVMKECSLELLRFKVDCVVSFSEIIHSSCYVLEQSWKNVSVLMHFLSGSPQGGSGKNIAHVWSSVLLNVLVLLIVLWLCISVTIYNWWKGIVPVSFKSSNLAPELLSITYCGFCRFLSSLRTRKA